MKYGKNGMKLDLLNPGGWLCSGQHPSLLCGDRGHHSGSSSICLFNRIKTLLLLSSLAKPVDWAMPLGRKSLAAPQAA